MLPTKLIVARNLANLRKKANLTQAELAEKLDYTDKSISKWEHGETMPDIDVLKQLADFYGVSLDYLVTEHVEVKGKEKVKKKESQYHANKWVLAALTVSAVWLAAVVLFFVGTIKANLEWPGGGWVVFVWAAPASSLVFLAFNSVWGNNKGWRTSLIILSIWLLLGATYVQIGMVMPEGGWLLWEIFLIGVPLTVVAALWDKLIVKNHDE